MGRGTGFGKTILIGDQFVLRGVPAIVSCIPYETVATVERIVGEGWVLEDNRIEVPGYKDSKKEQEVRSINRILQVVRIDAKKAPIKISFRGTLVAGSGVCTSATSCVSLIRALDEEFNLGFSIDEINQVAWQEEFAIVRPDFIIPRVAILDPCSPPGLPQGLTASTGVDALPHSLEVCTSLRANLIGDMVAEEAISARR